MITVIAIGKKHEPWITDGLERYQKRLKKPFDLSWVLLPHSLQSDTAGAQEESDRIRSKLVEGTIVILCDERGTNMSSPELASLLETQFVRSRPVVIVIGGAFGVDEQLRQRADYVWSLSRLVFPHQLVRLMLTEQLYRAQSISHNEPYHHS